MNIEKNLNDAGLIWQADVPLKNLTHWQIGGPADFLVQPKNSAEALAALKIAKESGLNNFVIGHGSNILFDDAGFRGMIIKIGGEFSGCEISGVRVRADAGIWAPNLARSCAENGLAGLEHVSGIPGNLGGLLYMNGGSLRQNIGDRVVWVEFLNENGEIKRLSREECGFSYRHSVFQGKNWIILGAELELQLEMPERILLRIDEILAERNAKFPLELPNCGSVFSNNEKLYATFGPPGKVIDDTGLKGTRVGNAQVSYKHANFIVNLGGASSADIFELVKIVRQKVYERTGFVLRCEVLYISPDGYRAPLDKFLG